MCLHSGELYRAVRQLLRTGCGMDFEGSSDGEVSEMVDPKVLRRDGLLKGYSELHITDKFEYLNMWHIISLIS